MTFCVITMVGHRVSLRLSLIDQIEASRRKYQKYGKSWHVLFYLYWIHSELGGLLMPRHLAMWVLIRLAILQMLARVVMPIKWACAKAHYICQYSMDWVWALLPMLPVANGRLALRLCP
jgi:hypothetical protein